MTQLRVGVFLWLAFSASAAAGIISETGHDEVVYYADAYAAHYGIRKELIHAIITQESGWNPKAVSARGAMGLMQLMPATAAEYGVRDPFDISENLSGGVRYLADLMQQFDGDFRLVLAAYYRGSRPILRRGLHYSGADVYKYVASVRRLYFAELAIHKSPANLVLGGD
jgi:soluble lytic murein transglycosylase-like protein